MGARENKFQISQNEILHIKIYLFYLCLHNSCEIWNLIAPAPKEIVFGIITDNYVYNSLKV